MSDNEETVSKFKRAGSDDEEQREEQEGDGKHQEQNARHDEQQDEQETNEEQQSTSAPTTAWQAIFSPQHNAYYFYNIETQETTWTNPLQPAPGPSDSAAAEPAASTDLAPESDLQPIASSSASSYAAMQAAAAAAGIDPSLAYLDPTLSSLPGTSTSTPTLSSNLPTFTAKFNARTGQFTRPDARDPTHLSEYDRAKRMSEFYFDVAAWEREVAQRDAAAAAEGNEEGGKKRKRPTKKDLERFKEQKKLKKIAKTAWLRT